MKPLTRSGVTERRDRYYALRREGAPKHDAAAAVGVHGLDCQAMYERWFQAIERGETPVAGHQERRAAGR